jgi:hypothetical protein
MYLQVGKTAGDSERVGLGEVRGSCVPAVARWQKGLLCAAYRWASAPPPSVKKRGCCCIVPDATASMC